MHEVSQEALRITSELNNSYHTPEEIRNFMSHLTGKPIDESFAMFPPFYTGCGKNIAIWENVFIDAGCKFQGRGGITIGGGFVVAAGTAVTKAFPENTIVGGVPAKFIKVIDN